MKNRLFLFWTIGKNVYEKQNYYDNVVAYYEKYLSYYFGNSYLFTRENIKYMEIFYLNFPMFFDDLMKISWEQYLMLFKISDKKERYFYFKLSLLFKSNCDETREFIDNNYFVRI